jgi:sugar phosphate isomerase/epimerase
MFRNLNVNALGVSVSGSELIELALSHGFKSIDLDIAEFHRRVQAQGLAQSRRLYDSARLKWGSFVLPIDWQADEATFAQDLEKLAPLAELARDLGCTRATSVMQPASDERPYHQNFELHRKRFIQVGAALAPHGVRVGLEFVAPACHRQGRSFEFIHDLDALLTLVGMAGQANVGVALDLWQVHLAGGNLDALRRLSAGQIVSVCVADAPADLTAQTATDTERLLPGETGVIDTAAALAALAELGYEGPVTPCPHPDRFKGQKRDAIVRQTGQALDAAWTAAGLNPAGKLVPQVK